MTIVVAITGKTLLDGVNEVLKKAKLIQGDSGLLITLSDSARQLWIDNAVQAWSETIEELYSITEQAQPQELTESTIILVTGDRDYELLEDLNVLHWPLMDETTGLYIWEHKADYMDLVAAQPVPSNFTGLPSYGVIRPTDGQLYLDRIPTASEDGLIYKYRYDRDISVSDANDTFPFKANVFRALVPAVTEIFNLYHRREFADGVYNTSMGRASRLMTMTPMRTSYLPEKIKRSNLMGVAYPFDE